MPTCQSCVLLNRCERLTAKLGLDCRDSAAQESAVSSLRDEISRLKRDRRRMQKAVEAAEGEAAALRPALAQAQQRCTQVVYHLQLPLLLA